MLGSRNSRWMWRRREEWQNERRWRLQRSYETKDVDIDIVEGHCNTPTRTRNVLQVDSEAYRQSLVMLHLDVESQGNSDHAQMRTIAAHVQSDAKMVPEP